MNYKRKRGELDLALTKDYRATFLAIHIGVAR